MLRDIDILKSGEGGELPGPGTTTKGKVKVKKDTYNGWTNWATWNVSSWLDNAEIYYKIKTNLIKAYRYTTIKADDAEYIAVAALGTRRTPDFERGSAGAAEWKSVDWAELADHFDREREEYEREEYGNNN